MHIDPGALLYRTELLSLLFRGISRRPVINLMRPLLARALDRFEDVIPREMFLGLDTFFYRDGIGNVDLDGDGVDDSFCITITNSWFNQRITGIYLRLDGKAPDRDDVIVRSSTGEIHSPSTGSLAFPPGQALEIIVSGQTLADGLHFLQLELDMELVPLLMPGVPVLMRDGRGDFPVLPDAFREELPYPPAYPPGDGGVTVHFVPHIHYDVEWLQKAATFERVGADNLLEVTRLMEEFPDYTFVLDQVLQLEPFRRRHPESFGRLVQFAEEGRIELVNGLYAEPDTNLISGESLARQSAIWQDYCRSLTGEFSRSGWLIDSFGMSAQLPQILAASGVNSLFFSRAEPEGWVTSEFLWQGLDGTALRAHYMPMRYDAGYPVPLDKDRASQKFMRDIDTLSSRSLTDQVFYPSGVDHGWPQATAVERIEEWNRDVEGARMEFSLPGRFFSDVREEDMPVLEGEFNRELWGTYGARIEIKKANREAEFALCDAEKLSSLAHLSGKDYPHRELRELWELLFSCQFHDQICGCCTDEVAEGVEERLRRVRSGALSLTESSADAICGGKEPREDFPASLLVFNPHGFPIREPVEAEVELPPGAVGFRVTDEGPDVPLQVTYMKRYGDGSSSRVRFLFLPDLPPLGYALFPLETVDEVEPYDQSGGELRCGRWYLENSRIRVEIGEDSGLIDRLSLSSGTEFDMGGGARLALKRDLGSLYDTFVVGRAFPRRPTIESMSLEETGPLRATILVRGRIHRSRYSQRISLSAGSQRVDIRTDVDFDDPHCRLDYLYPTDIEGGRWIHEIPYGYLERPAHELPALNYVDLSDEGRGIAFINLGTPGHELMGSTVRMTLLRSCDRAFLFRTGVGGLETGKHAYKHALYPHEGDCGSARPWVQAYIHNDPPSAFPVPSGFEISAGARRSALGVTPEDFLISALMIDRSGRPVIRIWDAGGKGGLCVLKPSFSHSSASLTDLLGREIAEIPAGERGFELELRPFEIATVRLSASEV